MNIKCPSCGAPAPLSTASPNELRCASCGFVGPMPEHAREALVRGAAALRALDVKKMQLGKLARRSLTSARFHVVVIILAALILGTPLALVVLGCLTSSFFSPTSGIENYVACSLPLVIFVAMVVLAILWIGRVRRQLLAVTAATPPEVPGQPAHCRMCGAPLATGTVLVVRCDHCRADNLVSPAAFAAASARRAGDLGDLEASIHRSGAAMKSATRQIVFALFVTVLGTPFFTFVIVVLLSMTVGEVEGEIDDTQRYAIVDTPGGRCIGVVTIGGYEHPVWVSFGGEEGALTGIAYETTDELELVRIRDLVGLRVREHAEPHREGTIARAFGTRGGYNYVELRPSDVSVVPEGLCVVP